MDQDRGWKRHGVRLEFRAPLVDGSRMSARRLCGPRPPATAACRRPRHCSAPSTAACRRSGRPSHWPQISARGQASLGPPPRMQRRDPLPTGSTAARQARSLECPQLLRDHLTGEVGVRGESGVRRRAAPAQSRRDTRARPVTERGEHRRRVGDVPMGRANAGRSHPSARRLRVTGRAPFIRPPARPGTGRPGSPAWPAAVVCPERRAAPRQRNPVEPGLDNGQQCADVGVVQPDHDPRRGFLAVVHVRLNRERMPAEGDPPQRFDGVDRP